MLSFSNLATHQLRCVPSWSTALGPQKAQKPNPGTSTGSRAQCAQKAIFWKKIRILKFIHWEVEFSFSIPATHQLRCVPSWFTARAPAPLPPYIVWDSSLSWVWWLRCNKGNPLLTQSSKFRYRFLPITYNTLHVFYSSQIHFIIHIYWNELVWVLSRFSCFSYMYL